MVSSVDGKIDGAALRGVMDEAEYEATAAKLNGDAWICGRTTMVSPACATRAARLMVRNGRPSEPSAISKPVVATWKTVIICLLILLVSIVD